MVDKSLVVAETDDDGGLRYRMLESIRQYVQERLEASGNAETVRVRHACYFVSLAEAAGPQLRSREQIETARRMTRETDNFRVVLDWAVETGSPDPAMRLIAPLEIAGTAIGYSAMDWAGTAVEIPGAHECRLFPDVASWATISATMRGDFERAEGCAAFVDDVQAARGERRASACYGAGTLALFRDDMDQAQRRAEEWVALARAGGQSFDLAHALIMLGSVQGMRGDHDSARATLEEAVRIGREAAIPSALSIGLAALGPYLPIIESERILAIADEAIEISTQVGDGPAVDAAINTRGWVTAYRDDHAAALDDAVHGAERVLQSGDFAALTRAVLLLGAVALANLGRSEPAAVLDGAGHRVGVVKVFDWSMQLITDAEAALVADLGATHLEILRARGADLAPADALAYLISVPQITTG